MKKYIIFFIGVVLPSSIVLLITRYWISHEKDPNYGAMWILSITFIALVLYTYINYLILKVPDKPFGTLTLINNERMESDLRVIVKNECRIPLKAKLFLNPTIYGKAVKLPPEFATYFGKKYWELAPGMGINGHITTKSILDAMGKTKEEMQSTYSPEVANQQLRIEAEIMFEDYDDKYNIFKPKIKQKMIYDFYRKVWIYEV